MKKIIAIILTVLTVMLAFTGCGANTKKEDLTPLEAENVLVEVSKIIEAKEIFENRVPSNEQQKNFQENILYDIEAMKNGEMDDQNFIVTISKEIYKSREECNNCAEAIQPGKSHLGSASKYQLWQAQRILNNEISWEDAIDKASNTPTIAFEDANTWTGKCTCWFILDKVPTYGEGTVWFDSYHAKNRHEFWQAFVVTPAED